MGRAQRTSSNLGEDPRGDTSAPAFSTSISKAQQDAVDAANKQYAAEKAARPHSKRRKARSFFRKWKQISYRHTWLNPLIIILVVLVGYAINPTSQNPIRWAIFLSYDQGPEYLGGPHMYGKGLHDLTFVSFYTVVLSFTREFLMQRVIRPVAVYAGLRNRGKQARFMEQAYTAMYFAIFGPFGLYVMSQSTLWYFNTAAMFEGYPHRSHEFEFKLYYLLQASYWAQQAIVLMLQLEKPRKDFKELVLHHIVTLALIGLSYRFHFAKMGIAVYITHDISDFFLATSKTLNYLDSVIVGPYFAMFIGIWIYLRHYLNLCILWATLTEFRTVGPFDLNWETQQYKCWLSQCITFALLASLQAVNVFWLVLILRIAKNYVFASDLADSRSDVEDTEEDEALATHANGSGKKGGAQKILEQQCGRDTDSPVVLLNGKPVETAEKMEARPEGIKERKKKR